MQIFVLILFLPRFADFAYVVSNINVYKKNVIGDGSKAYVI